MTKRWTIQDVEMKLQPAGKGVRVPAKKKATPRPSTANTLTKQALRVLDLKGFYAWRQNSAGVYDVKKGVFRKNSATPGISDILGFHRKTGIIIACEIKAGNDRLSRDQEMFLDSVRRAGGIAIVVGTVDDLERFYKKDLGL